MAETITREAWLRLELEAARDYVARFGDSSNPIEQAQVSRRLREAQVIEDELGRLSGATVITFRLVGPAIEGNNAPPELVKEIIQTLVGPSQLELPTFNTFAEAASAVIDLSPDVVQAGESLEDHALAHSAGLTAATLAALRQMMGTMSRYLETADRVYKGRVPKAMRAAADGIPLGSAVHAEIEEITATFQSGDRRVRYRLKTIAGADGEGP